MPEFLGFEVHVTADGNILEEFGTEKSEERRTATCYIPSEVGQFFAIKFKNGGDALLGAEVYVDGTGAAGIFVDPGVTHIIEGVCATATSIRPFKFTKLELTDDDSTLAETQKIIDNMGQIEVSLYRVIRGKAVHEKGKNMGCHRVSLGDTVQNRVTTMYDVSFVDSKKKPYATFIFRYRSLSLLQARGVVPLPQQHSREKFAERAPRTNPKGTVNTKRPTEEDISPPAKRHDDGKPEVHVKGEQGEELSESQREQLVDMEKQLEELQARIERTKADFKDSNGSVKREPSPICVPPAPKGGHRVVIDLTL